MKSTKTMTYKELESELLKNHLKPPSPPCKRISQLLEKIERLSQ